MSEATRREQDRIKDVYRYYLEQTGQPDQSFESARRVFRGGPVTGGAPSPRMWSI